MSLGARQRALTYIRVHVQSLAPHSSAGLDRKGDVKVPRGPSAAPGVPLAANLEHTLCIHTCACQPARETQHVEHLLTRSTHDG